MEYPSGGSRPFFSIDPYADKIYAYFTRFSPDIYLDLCSEITKFKEEDLGLAACENTTVHLSCPAGSALHFSSPMASLYGRWAESDICGSVANFTSANDTCISNPIDGLIDR